MKVLLIGNYSYLKSQSMDRFAAMLYDGLKNCGHDVCLLKPQPFIGRLRPSPVGIGKWLGYLDRFILFRPKLLEMIEWADVVHICDQANSVYVPWLKGKPHVVTCHDMLAIRSALEEIPEHQTRITGKIYQRWILLNLKKAMRVVCVSETTREDVLRLTGLLPEKVTVVYNGLNYPYRPMPEEEFSEYLKKMDLVRCRPFFLHVGNNNWYKNRPGLLRIFAQIIHRNSSNWHLVLAGAPMPENLIRLARELNIQGRIRQAINLSNKQLCALYSAAVGLIFPSLAEGFGWPILEAQACGCPVFTSNSKPMTEVAGGGAAHFDPNNVYSAADQILNFLKNKKSLVESGYQNIVKYSAEEMIFGYINEYNR